MEINAITKRYAMNSKHSKRIGWINDQWGPLTELSVPLIDRGLNLADGIFETIQIYYGEPLLFSRHINRWHVSASMLNMATPPAEDWISTLINQGIQHVSLQNKHGVVRLNWSRGNNYKRGINISQEIFDESTHRFWLEISPGAPCFTPLSTMISRFEKRNANSRLSVCKTFAYGQAIQARQEAKSSGFDDALLLSTDGSISCGSTANLIVKRNNQWLTPPLKTGCLPGIMRQQGIDNGFLKEIPINPVPINGDEWLLINSLGCRPIYKLQDQSLELITNPQNLWLSYINTVK